MHLFPSFNNPYIKLTSNKYIALRVYNQQIKKLDKSAKDKFDVIQSVTTLQNLGFVDFFSNLSNEEQEMLNESEMKYYIPWRVLWKESSVSTPCRMVLDASHPSSTGFDLNDVLAKGINGMNKLVEIIIR